MLLTLTRKQKIFFIDHLKDFNDIKKQTEKKIQHEKKTLFISFDKEYITIQNYARTRTTQQKRGKDRAKDIAKAIEKHKKGE